MSLTVDLDITNCVLFVVTVLATLLTGSSLQWVIDQGGLSFLRYLGCMGCCCGISTEQLMELEAEESRALSARQQIVQANSQGHVHVKGIGRIDLASKGATSYNTQRSYRERLFDGIQLTWQSTALVLNNQNQQYYLIVSVAAITSLIQVCTFVVSERSAG